MMQLCKILPSHPPGARADKISAFIAQIPFRMYLLQPRAPTGMVDHDVDKHPPAAGVCRIGELSELVNPSRASIELDESGIDRGEILGGIRAAEAPEFRK